MPTRTLAYAPAVRWVWLAAIGIGTFLFFVELFRIGLAFSLVLAGVSVFLAARRLGQLRQLRRRD